MPAPSTVRASSSSDPTARLSTAPQHILDEMASSATVVEGRTDTQVLETGRPALDEASTLPVTTAPTHAEIWTNPRSASCTPSTPPDSDEADVNAPTSSAHAESSFSKAAQNPSVTIDVSQWDHLYHLQFWCGSIIWANLRGNDRYWVVMQSHGYHCVVLPIYTFDHKGLQGAVQVAEMEYISIRDWGTSTFENQRPELEPLITTGKINRGLDAKSVIHITRPSFLNHNDRTVCWYGSLTPCSMFRLRGMYHQLQFESYHRETLRLTLIHDLTRVLAGGDLNSTTTELDEADAHGAVNTDEIQTLHMH